MYEQITELYENAPSVTNCGGNRDETAYSCGGTLAAAELGAISDAVCAFLLKKHIKNVVLFGHKSPLLYAALVGCLKAQVCYTVADSSTPPARYREYAADIMLYDGDAPDCTVASADIADICARFGGASPDMPPENLSAPAYRVYTSGTTGFPKGIEVTRRNLKSFLGWFLSIPTIAEIKPKSVLNQALFSFDLSVADIFYCLSVGARLTALDKSLFGDFPKLFSEMAASGAEMAVLTPSFAELCLCDRSFCSELMPLLKIFFRRDAPLRYGGKATQTFSPRAYH